MHLQLSEHQVCLLVRDFCLPSAWTNVIHICIGIVPAGHRAVVFDRVKGVKQDVKGEGLHFRIPWLQVGWILLLFWNSSVLRRSVGTVVLRFSILSHILLVFL